MGAQSSPCGADIKPIKILSRVTMISIALQFFLFSHTKRYHWRRGLILARACIYDYRCPGFQLQCPIVSSTFGLSNTDNAGGLRGKWPLALMVIWRRHVSHQSLSTGSMYEGVAQCSQDFGCHCWSSSLPLRKF